jgi:D-serine deaminase-like pyridoxal phosphate-dependent protein
MDYSRWSQVLDGQRLPAVVVDLDAFDRNVAQAARIAADAGKKVRIATKSIRVPELIARILKKLNSEGVFQGLMCFSAEEADFLRSEHGMDDLLIAYPTVQASDLEILKRMHQSGATVALVVDHRRQVELLAQAMAGSTRPFRVVLDIDMSLRPWGGILHLGVRRSPIRTVDEALALAQEVSKHGSLRLVGIMAYEAQVAGLGDRNPFKKLLNPIFGWLRRTSIQRVARLRAEIAQALHSQGHAMEIVNGAGTGSLNLAAREEALTEITLGSGFLCSHLFDYYSNIRFEPACFFALQVVRSSDPGYVTCLGGGYIASGEPGWDRVPVPWLPSNARLVQTEGCGEVQTPLRLTQGLKISLGAPVLFRHAKAGELAERFNEYLLVSNQTITARAKTYRGSGRCFV